MDADYDRCFDETELWEGGYSDVPGDPGGSTMRGLTQSSYDAYRRSHGLTTQDVRRVTASEIKAIFKNAYWAPGLCDFFFPGLDMVQFDESINSGPRKAVALLEEALGTPVTQAAIDAVEDRRGLIQKACDARVRFWESLSGEKRFLAGWLNRGRDVEAKALAMFDAPQKVRGGAPVSQVPPTAACTAPIAILPDVTTIRGLQRALTMLGYRIAVDGDYGPETRQAVTSFQMHVRIVADGTAGAQTEAELLNEIGGGRRSERGNRVEPV
jgi:lysozyme family protein